MDWRYVWVCASSWSHHGFTPTEAGEFQHVVSINTSEHFGNNKKITQMLNLIAVEILWQIALGKFVALYSFNASLTSFPSGVSSSSHLLNCVWDSGHPLSRSLNLTLRMGSKAIHPGSQFMPVTHGEVWKNWQDERCWQTAHTSEFITSGNLIKNYFLSLMFFN